MNYPQDFVEWIGASAEYKWNKNTDKWNWFLKNKSSDLTLIFKTTEDIFNYWDKRFHK